MACKGICERHKAGKPYYGSRYADGQSRCKVCMIFIYWDGARCPCCNQMLSKNPKSKKYKELYRKELKIEVKSY